MSDEVNKTTSIWQIIYDHYDPVSERRREAVFALGNGVFMTRAATCDAQANAYHYPGTYRAGCYDKVCSEIEGVRDETETLVNLPNWLPLTFAYGDGDWFSLDGNELMEYEHGLDLRAGMAWRRFRIKDARGCRTRVEETRFVSMAEPSRAALRLSLTPENWEGPVRIRSCIDGMVANTNVIRYEDYPHHHLARPACEIVPPDALVLRVETTSTGVVSATASRTVCNLPFAGRKAAVEAEARIAEYAGLEARAGRTLTVDKLVALCTSLEGGCDSPEQRAVALVQNGPGFEQLRGQHLAEWRRLWDRAAIEINNPEVARPLHFHAFHVLQTVSPHTVQLDAGIPARGWHGEGYRGHVFWDELFVLPFLDVRFPELAREALLYRYRRLDAARAAARKAGYRGAMFPWRSASDGSEVTPRQQKNLLNGAWMPDHTRLQRHIGAAIAFNVWQHYLATGDRQFLIGYGAELTLEIARFWASIARPTADGQRFEITGVIGPDEYHNVYPCRARPGLDNNAYTNLMAAWTLMRALDVLQQLPPGERDALCRRLAVEPDEPERWDEISRRLVVPFLPNGVIAQFDGFGSLPDFDPARLPPHLADQRRDWALHTLGTIVDNYRITKQADVLTFFHLLPFDEAVQVLERLGYRFSREDLRRTADYYLQRTTHRSSLSRVVYAGALASVDPNWSWEFFLHALSTDLHGLKGESIAEGIHLGAMGGTLDVLQRHYLGVSPGLDGLRVSPSLPQGLGEVRLRIQYQGQFVGLHAVKDGVEVKADEANAQSLTLLCPTGIARIAPGETKFVPSTI